MKSSLPLAGLALSLTAGSAALAQQQASREPSQTNHAKAVSEARADEPGRGDEKDSKAGDHRAAEARAAKLADADIATAPIREVRSVTRHQAVIIRYRQRSSG